MTKERKTRSYKKSYELRAAIRDYQSLNTAAQEKYASNYTSWVKQLKKIDPEMAEYMGL